MASLAGHCEHAPACLHPSQRHAACAALLGDVCRASADEVSGALLGFLSAQLDEPGAESAVGDVMPRVVAHGRRDLLLQVLVLGDQEDLNLMSFRQFI